MPKKSLGQNFLLDNNICKKIVDNSDIKNQIVFEIGPGTGQLTDQIINKKPKELIIIEKDKFLYDLLSNKYKNLKNVKILSNDALKIDYSNKKNIVIISNLPYNISTKFIIHLLKNFNNIKEMIFMVQKEVAIKMDYKKNIKQNKYSLFINSISKYETIFHISNKVFYPRPKIKSSVIRINPTNDKDIDKNKLWNFTFELFKNKRKIIKMLSYKDDKKNSKRAEDLDYIDFWKLFNQF